MWYYKDPKGQEHGPFSEENMRMWFNQNYFEPSLLIRKESEKNFAPLHEVDPAFTRPVPLPSKVEPFQAPVPVKAEPTSTPQPVVPTQPVVPQQVPQKRKLDDTGFAEPLAKKPKPKKVPPKSTSAEEQWIYLDNSKNIQGPFPTSTMRGWWESGALHDTLPIKLYIPGLTSLTDKTLFTALKEYPRCSFTIPPEQIEQQKPEDIQTVAAAKAKKIVKRKKLKPPKKWYYRDPEGTERGPFSLVLMRQWYLKQYIPLDTPVRAENVQNYVPIHTKLQIFEDKEKANENKTMNQSLWTFIDDEGRIQGPFEKFVLKSWHEFGWLPYDIRVRRIGETYYIPWGDRIKSFLEESDDEDEASGKHNDAELEKLRPNANQDKWFYKDDGGAIQGPFTAEAMRGWFEDGFFMSRTEVRKGEDAAFMPLRQMDPPPPWIAGLRFPDEPAMVMHVPHPMMMHHPMMMMHPPPESMWFYMAAGDKAVGPYPLSQIQTWHREGYFNDRVKVARAESAPNYDWKSIVETECAWKPHPGPHPGMNPNFPFNPMNPMNPNPYMMNPNQNIANPANAQKKPTASGTQSTNPQAQMTAAINNLAATINSAPAVQLPQVNASPAVPQKAQLTSNVASASPVAAPVAQPNPQATPQPNMSPAVTPQITIQPKVNSAPAGMPPQMTLPRQNIRNLMQPMQQINPANFVAALAVPQMNATTPASAQILQQLQAATQRVVNNPAIAALRSQVQAESNATPAAPVATPTQTPAQSSQQQPPHQEFLE